jgi:hypothetical protein
MSLRSFKAFTNAAPVSPSALIDALGTVTETMAKPCTLVNLDGYAAAAGWFQIFDLAVAPTSTVTVPLKSIRVAAAGGIGSLLETLAPLTLNKGLYVAMSSTEAVYTAVATNFDVWGEVEEYEVQLSGTTVAGDLTTPADSLIPWTDAQGPKKLLRLDILPDGLTAARYLMLFPGVPADGDKPLRQWKLTLSATLVTTLKFADGISPLGMSSAGAVTDGCYLKLSDTTRVLTYSGSGAGDSMKIRAFYK